MGLLWMFWCVQIPFDYLHPTSSSFLRPIAIHWKFSLGGDLWTIIARSSPPIDQGNIQGSPHPVGDQLPQQKSHHMQSKTNQRYHWSPVHFPHGSNSSSCMDLILFNSISFTPGFSGLCHFKDGRNFSQWTGNDSKALMKVRMIIFCSSISNTLSSVGLDACNWGLCSEGGHPDI